jgi:hypothetical protein
MVSAFASPAIAGSSSGPPVRRSRQGATRRASRRGRSGSPTASSGTRSWSSTAPSCASAASGRSATYGWRRRSCTRASRRRRRTCCWVWCRPSSTTYPSCSRCCRSTRPCPGRVAARHADRGRRGIAAVVRERRRRGADGPGARRPFSSRSGKAPTRGRRAAPIIAGKGVHDEEDPGPGRRIRPALPRGRNGQDEPRWSAKRPRWRPVGDARAHRRPGVTDAHGARAHPRGRARAAPTGRWRD